MVSRTKARKCSHLQRGMCLIVCWVFGGYLGSISLSYIRAGGMFLSPQGGGHVCFTSAGRERCPPQTGLLTHISPQVG